MKKICIFLTFLFFSFNVKAAVLLQDISFSVFFDNLTKEILNKAGKSNLKIDVNLLKEDELNAFATIDNQIFVNSGLIAQLEDPDLVICVLAHEVAHILHGDIYKFDIYRRNSIGNLILSSLFGVGGALAAGGDSSVAVSILTMNFDNNLRAERAFNRQIETSADYEAIKIISKMGIDPHKYSVLLNKMRNNAIAFENEIYKDYLTHPEGKQRITQAKTVINQQKINNNKTQQIVLNKLYNQYDFLRQKLIGYFYPEKIAYNNKLAEIIKNAHIHLKQDSTLKVIEQFRNEETDLILNELTAELYYYNGNLEKSVTSYEKMLNSLNQMSIKKDSEIYILGFLSYLSTKNQLYKNNVNELKKIRDNCLKINTKSKFLESVKYDILSNIYGNLKELDNAYYYLAYSYFLNNRKDEAKKYLKLGERHAKSPNIQEKYKFLRKIIE